MYHKYTLPHFHKYGSYGFLRSRVRLIRITCLALLFLVAIWPFFIESIPLHSERETIEWRYPLAWKHIHSSNQTGGAWYIPPQWLDSSRKQPQNIIEAARLASRAAASNTERQVAFSNIPLLVHQTWKNTRIDSWDIKILSWVETWLSDSIMAKRGPAMAYFFWNDEGMRLLVEEFESDFLDFFDEALTPVERSDVFRILVVKYFGGIYGDVDTEPLQHPATWVHRTDLASWTDPENAKSYGQRNASSEPEEHLRPVNLLWGLEADSDPTSDSYWRMGYTYPVQLTQWALASAPKHPALDQFMSNLYKQITDKSTPQEADPLTRTGPAAVTLATKTWLEQHVGFRWNALTGLEDGGKSKLVDDVLVLPITGFSPGRGKYGNMGSKPVTDRDARLCHHARGSWRHFDPIVEYGKFCRTFFGLCKDWSKVSK